MKSYTEQELRQILFGRAPFAKQREHKAPEPHLLAQLAPEIPAQVLGLALNTLADVGKLKERLRPRLLAPLVEAAVLRAPDALDPRILAGHPRVADHVSPKVAGALEPYVASIDPGARDREEIVADLDRRLARRRRSPDPAEPLPRPHGMSWSVPRLRRSFHELDEATREALMKELVDRIRDRYGGSGPATTAEPDLQGRKSVTISDHAEYEQEGWLGPGDGGQGDGDGGAEAGWDGGSDDWEDPSWLDMGEGGGDTQATTGPKAAGSTGAAPGTGNGGEQAPAADAGQTLHVSRGFSGRHDPAEEHPPHLPLEAGTSGYFWLQIADRRLPGDVGGDRGEIPADLLPDVARLTVAVFAFADDIAITPGADVGEIEVRRKRGGLTASVIRPAAMPDLPDEEGLLRSRLFFPVTLPRGRDLGRLRCNLYCSGVLVQSHLVTARLWSSETRSRGDVEWGGLTLEYAEIMADPGADHHPYGVNAEVDYTLSHSLRPEALAPLPPHRLSVLMNSDPDGSHSFHFFAAEGDRSFKHSPSLDPDDLDTLLGSARRALRLAAWGSKEGWRDGMAYRYEDPVDLRTLTTDLARMAKAGRRIYSALNDALAGGGGADAEEAERRRRELRELTARTGLLQIASKDSATELVPAALIHDLPVDSVNLASRDFRLCPEVESAIVEAEPLSGTACFQGLCPSARDRGVVCPSGFWGYRHDIGMPLSVPEEGDSVAADIVYEGQPRLAFAKWSGIDFEDLEEHEEALGAALDRSHPGWRWADASSEDAVRRQFLGAPHLVYFYCHGGLAGDLPYLQVGSDAAPFKIDLTVLEDLNELDHLFWRRPRPLVVLNGCHTTALRPGDAFNLVTPFIRKINAAGVIGSEITIFEPLAAAFGEAFLGRFLAGVPLGEAVRLSRLDLLAERNPLGLAYIPFALGNLTLRRGEA